MLRVPTATEAVRTSNLHQKHVVNRAQRLYSKTRSSCATQRPPASYKQLNIGVASIDSREMLLQTVRKHMKARSKDSVMTAVTMTDWLTTATDKSCN
jgi:hypothetical protein